EAPVERPHLLAVLLDDARGAVLERVREAAFEHVRRLDQVVVDGDDRVADLPGAGLGEEQRRVEHGGHPTIVAPTLTPCRCASAPTAPPGWGTGSSPSSPSARSRRGRGAASRSWTGSGGCGTGSHGTPASGWGRWTARRWSAPTGSSSGAPTVRRPRPGRR